MDTPLGRYCAIDFETTGSVAGYPVEPWQVGIVCVEGGEIVSTWESLIRLNRRPFHPKAPGRHDECMEEILVAPTPWEVLEHVKALCGESLMVGHNVATEQKCLRHLAPLHRFGPWIDTLKLSRAVYPDLKGHSLLNVVRSMELQEALDALLPGREAHDALYDAAASALILQKMLGSPGWERVDVALLMHPDQSAFFQNPTKGL